MKKLLCIICLLFLTGCGLFPTRKNLRINYSDKFEVSIEEPYQKVYRHLLEQVRGGNSWVWLGDRGIIENDLYPDTKSATIRSARVNVVGGEYMQILFDFEALSDTQTRITVYYCKHGFNAPISKERFEEGISKWHEKNLK